MRNQKAKVLVLAFLVLLLAGVPQAPFSQGSTRRQLCTDQGSGPLIQNKDWRQYRANYSDYATQYTTPFVMKEGTQFIMYLRIQSNSTSDIYRWTSPDGTNWSATPTPVLTTGPNGTWDSSSVFSPAVVWNGTGYVMYYVGDGAYPANFRQIGAAFSSNGVTWTKYAGNPVITHGPGVYDIRYTRGPNVIYDSGTYKMWYFGTPSLASFSNYTSNIDYATSTDGVHWAKYGGNPVLTGFNDSGTLVAHSPSVLEVNGTYLMAFSDGFANIGFATSTDGTRWNFNNRTNILESLTGWHTGYVDFPSIMLIGNRLYLWFVGTANITQLPRAPYAAGIGLATCGVAIIPPPTEIVSTETSVTTVVSTSISTSTNLVTLASTTTVYRNAPFSEQVSVAAVGVAAGLAVAVVALYLKTKSAGLP